MAILILFRFLIKDKTLVFLSRIRLFGFLIQDKTSRFSYLILEIDDIMLKENKAHTKTAPEFAVKKVSYLGRC